jgi:4-alpha-glucanotransferase
MITDIFGQAKRFNVPGPMSDSNWTERMDVAVSDFDKNPKYKNYIELLDTLLAPS